MDRERIRQNWNPNGSRCTTGGLLRALTNVRYLGEDVEVDCMNNENANPNMNEAEPNVYVDVSIKS